jgi:hypothetical protein
MKPSETSVGAAWLENFRAYDQPAATMLIDSLRFVDVGTMQSGLKARIERLAEMGTIQPPALVVPERSLKSLPLERKTANPVAFQDFEPGAGLSILPGSEAFAASIIRDLLSEDRSTGQRRWIASDAGLLELRQQRCRSVVVIADYIGSGQQVLRLIEAIARNPTIRSWRSYHLLRSFVVAFAIADDAFTRLEASRVVDAVWSAEAAPTFWTAPWTDCVRGAIVDLCRRECFPKYRSRALGYKGSCGLFASQRGAPNNLPALFIQQQAGWQPLFPGRVVPTSFAEELAEGYQQTETLADLAERVGQLRVGRNERITSMPRTSKELLGALLALSPGPKATPHLAAELGLGMPRTEMLVDSLRRLGLIDEDASITAAGRREIQGQRRGLRRTTAKLVGSDDPYYPASLR